MEASDQIIISSDTGGADYSVIVSDLRTGSRLTTYSGGGVSAPNCLSLIGSDYIVSAQTNSPQVHFWSLGSKNQINKKFIAPEKVHSLTCSPCGTYCLAGLREKIAIWHVPTGELITTLDRGHYQPITVLKFSNDGSHFVSGSEDGRVAVWILARSVSGHISVGPYGTGLPWDKSHTFGATSTLSNENASSMNKQPLHLWSDHNGPVKDVCITNLTTLSGRVATCSADNTCLVYNILSGRQLLAISCDTALHCLAMDPAVNSIFMGGDNGSIYEVHFYERQTTMQCPPATFKGHSERVNCLAISPLDGLALVSGSLDGTIRIWHVHSKHCMRTINMSGSIMNLLVVPMQAGLLHDLHVAPPSSRLPLANFQREKNSRHAGPSDLISLASGNVFVSTPLETSSAFLHSSKVSYSESESSEDEEENEKDEHISQLADKLSQYAAANEQLYKMAVDSLFKKAVVGGSKNTAVDVMLID